MITTRLALALNNPEGLYDIKKRNEAYMFPSIPIESLIARSYLVVNKSFY